MLQTEREILDKVHAGSFLVLFCLGIGSHAYSIIRLRDKNYQKRMNKSTVIYKHIFAMDILIIVIFIPFKLVWLLLKTDLVCKVTRFSAFMGFYGVMIFIIIMSVDRYSKDQALYYTKSLHVSDILQFSNLCFIGQTVTIRCYWYVFA